MSCEYCGYLVGHHSRCPNFKSYSIGKCAECEDDILPGEEFIELPSGKQYHVDCLSYMSIRKLLYLLDIDIQIEETENDNVEEF